MVFIVLIVVCSLQIVVKVCVIMCVTALILSGCQICTIVSNVPHLDFLNLSTNPLSGTELGPGPAQAFARVRQLVLINTHISWDTVHTLTQHTPE